MKKTVKTFKSILSVILTISMLLSTALLFSASASTLSEKITFVKKEHVESDHFTVDTTLFDFD